MPTITCPDCNPAIPDDADICDHCSKPIHIPEPVVGPGGSRKGAFVIWVVFVVLFLIVFWLTGR